MRPGWLVPDWPAPPGVRAVCTSRGGGQSLPPYDSLNLGDHVGDAAQAVAANRATLRRALGARPVFLAQQHGWQVVTLDPATPDGTAADGCVTRHPQLACTIMVADCLPVLLTDRNGTAVAAGHAGWRGLAGAAGHGILEELWTRFWPLVGTAPGPAAAATLAWLGPCIGSGAFEVGSEVRTAFASGGAAAWSMFKPHGERKWLADLQGLARLRLAALGVTQIYGNDGSGDWCTASNPSRFFSHRRDRVSGRLAASIWRA